MGEMYKPQNNGPHTTLAATINASQVSITVENASILPDAPNVLTIGTEEDAELVKLESKTGNILSVTRGFNGTTPKAWDSGAWIYRAITAQDIEELQERTKKIVKNLTAAEFEALTTEEKATLFASGVRVIAVEGDLDPGEMTDMQRFAAFAHPVGEIVHLTVPTNPATLWGFGTWEAIAAGRVLVGAGTADSGTVYTAGQTGGEETHTLTMDEMPKHHHNVYANDAGTSVFWGLANATQQSTKNAIQTNDKGGDQPHNNMQPYYVCYMWRRMA